MRLKWHFCNKPTPYFKETPVFATKSTCKPPKGQPNLEVILSQIEKELFQLAETSLGYSNFSKEEWQAMRALVNDRSIEIKKAGKGSNCGTPTEKASEFLDSQLKQVMQISRSYIKDSGDLLRKLKILVLFQGIPSWLWQMLWGYILVFLMRQNLRL